MANVRTPAYDFFDTEGTSAGLAVAGTAVTLTASIYNAATNPPQAKYALITVEDAQIRWWADGSTPTASWGLLANPNDVIELVGANNVANFRAIRATATSATLQVLYGH